MKTVLLFHLFFPMTEHQIRLCDDNQNIVEKLALSGAQFKKTAIYYAESPERSLATLGLSIRIKLKQNKAEVTVKKRIAKDETLKPDIQAICENDLHGGQKNRTCKIDSSVDRAEFEQWLEKKKHLSALLSKEQVNLLSRYGTVPEKAVVYGTLLSQRYQWTDKRFGEMTLDLVAQSGKEEIRFHELSIRYADSDLLIGSQFETFLSNTGIKACADQIKWPVNKFDTLEIIN